MFIDNRFTIPAAFVLGAAYAAVSLFQVYQLRDIRQRFRIELFAVAFFLLTAVVISALAAVATIDASLFITGYGVLIGLSFLVVLVTPLLFPDVATNTWRSGRSSIRQNDVHSSQPPCQTGQAENPDGGRQALPQREPVTVSGGGTTGIVTAPAFRTVEFSSP